ncbi:MAG: T9SS type A sorting domain-containing protein [Bacteroidota bacterium]
MKKLGLFLALVLVNLILLSQNHSILKYLNINNADTDFYFVQRSFNEYWKDRPYERSKGYTQFKRWEYRTEPHAFPNGLIPNSLKYRNEYIRFTKNQKELLSNGDWTPLGLYSWTSGSGYTPGNGRINAVTVDPSNSNVIYVAAPSGGEWKTNDGGTTWNTTFDNQLIIGASAIAIDPSNSDIVYVGTGDRDASHTMGIGIVKSSDGGASWNNTGLYYPINGLNVNKILINPDNTNIILAATDQGIFKSEDAAASWIQVYFGCKVTNLAYKPGNTNIIYACGDKYLRSNDQGNNFVQITSGLPSNTPRLELCVTPADSDYVYVVASDLYYGFNGLYKSDNSGLSFSIQSSSPNLLGYEYDGSDYGGIAWYDLAIASSPTNADEIYVSGVNLWKSTDGGVSWNINTYWYDWYAWYYGLEYIHADIHSVDFYGNTLFAGTDGGVYYSDNVGIDWHDISSGLCITQFYRMGSSEISPNLIIAGSQDNGANKYQNGSWTHIMGADIMECIIDNSNINTIYLAAYYGGMVKSINGGVAYSNVTPSGANGAWITPFVMHPGNPEILFAGYQDVYKTTNGASNWSQISNSLTGGDYIRTLMIAPSNPDYIYTSCQEKLYITTDGGSSWTTSIPNSNLYITGITIDNTNPSKIWICGSSSTNDKVYASIDAGSSFVDITGNLTNMGFNCIEYEYDSDDKLYLGTETGVFYTDSILNQWIPFSNGLPNVIINELEINYSSNKIRAATFGRGIWESPIDNSVNAENKEISDNIQVFPNPSDGKFNMSFKFSDNKNIELYIFNPVGILMKKYNLKNIKNEILTFDISDYVVGTYYLKIELEKQTIVKKIELVKKHQ